MMDFLFDIGSDLLSQIHKAPSYVLLFVALIAIGRLIKEIVWPPDRYIPLVLFFVSVTGSIMLGDPSAVNHEEPSPNTRLALVGVVIWLVAWLSYRLLLQHFEAWIDAKVKAFLPGAKAKTDKVEDRKFEREVPNGSPD